MTNHIQNSCETLILVTETRKSSLLTYDWEGHAPLIAIKAVKACTKSVFPFLYKEIIGKIILDNISDVINTKHQFEGQ